jgi:pimeloyl-ACP methyl ester carboxylesterase
MLAWAGDDKLFPLELRDRIGNVLSHARREVISGARTFAGEDQPVALARLIEDFVSTTPLKG